MKVGVISDTHDRLPTFKAAVEKFHELEVDMLLHAGDYVAPFAAKLIAPDAWHKPLVCIYGNNDGETAGLKNTLPNIVQGPVSVQAGGKKIVMHHYIDWFTHDDIAGADIVISGHTHGIVNEHREGRLYLNPGECCGWLTDRCTVALLHPEKLQAEILHIST